jgi:hypothetical protein
MTATPPDHARHTPGAGFERARAVLGWPELTDDPKVEAEFRAAEERADEDARRFYALRTS